MAWACPEAEAAASDSTSADRIALMGLLLEGGARRSRSACFGRARRLGPRWLAGVHDLRGLVHFAGQQQGRRLERAVYALQDGFALVGGRLAQHPVDHLGLHAGVADADAQAPV